MQIVYLNEKFLPVEQAQVSVLDRGFLFADGVYEVIPAYGRHLLRLGDHLQRLQSSLDGIRLSNPLSNERWTQLLNELISKNDGDDQSIYVQVTRGAAEKRAHAFPVPVRHTVFCMSTPLLPVSKQQLLQGIAAITLDDIRWHACHIKSTALLANVLASQQAVDKNASEAILLRDGMVTEGAVSNIFIVSHGVMLTPPKSPLLLPGITRDLIIELARSNAMVCKEQEISEHALRGADEIWITSSTREILPVVTLDGKIIADGKPGAVWHRMIDIYQEYKKRLRSGEES
ncbi:MAG: D-amino acid aminotransferase [Gammaproteobacteria bacterium]|jgi:D-alanine transaminase|nr:D-amino acid aminotransferase [Gammaproteobacteria bacterium]